MGNKISSTGHYITKGEICNQMFNLDIAGTTVRFTLDGIRDADVPWYCWKITSALKEVAAKSREEGRQEIRNQMTALMGGQP